MSYETYEVKVYVDGSTYWYQNGKYHRLDGPAIEYANGDKSYYIEGKKYTEEDFNEQLNPPVCNKVVTIEGVEYELKRVVK
jgi:hypothetical protein